MANINQKLELLAKEVIYINYNDKTTWNDYIKAFNKGLEIISDIMNQDNVSDDDYIALRKLMKELIKKGIDGPVTDIRSYKRNMLSELTAKLKEELTKIPDITEKEPEIKNVNDWIASLKIFKLNDKFLSTNYYYNSYDLYHDVRRIVLTKNPPIYKKIYLGRIADKIENQENKSKLPSNINLQVADYELAQLIKLIHKNPEFNYKLMTFSYQNSEINSRFEREEWRNNLLLLIKK